MQTLDYEFEELPLFTDLGFQFAPVNGVAEISYSDDGEWSVTDIRLEGAKQNPKWLDEFRTTGKSQAYFYKWQSLCGKSYPWLYDAIVDSLENNSSVQDRVNEELEREGVSFRSDYAEHNVLNRAQQGV